jgi:hypothetical protein
MTVLLGAARTLATERIVRRGAVIGALALAQRLLTPAATWVIFARPVQPMGVGLAVTVALGGVLAARAFLQRALSSRTEADLMDRVIGCLLDGDVLRTNVLPEEDAQADLNHGIFFAAQQLAEILPTLAADLVAAVLLACAVVWMEPARLVVAAAGLTVVAAGMLMWSRGRVHRATHLAWTLRERVVDKMVDAIEGRLEIVAAGEQAAFVSEAHELARQWGRAGVRAATAGVMSGRVPLLAIA